MKKVVILPGVGFHDQSDDNALVSFLRENLGSCIVQYFDWKHEQPLIKLPYDGRIHKKIRLLFEEIVFDFVYAMNHLHSFPAPDADVFIGHSAGSLLALAKNKPCVIFGSPVALLEQFQTRIKNGPPIVNIVNRYDILALPISQGGIVNYFYSANLFNPVSAHLDYWSNELVQKYILDCVTTFLA